jgi:hypothetical protein
MLKLVYERALYCQESVASVAISKIGRAGPVALLALLAGCASDGTKGQIFDHASLATHAAATTPVKTNGKTEEPKAKSASALLGAYQTGAGYAVQPNIPSDGRYNTYTFATKHGTYPVISDDLARKHIQELIALDKLNKYSMADEFVHGVGSAVASPVEGVIATVTDPIGTAKGTYANVERKVESVQRSASEAGEFIKTFGKPEKKRPGREDDGLLVKLVGTPKAKRRLAKALMVDPYTHFVPLAAELDKVASYSAAGEFGISKGVGFIPGAAGTVLSSVKTLDSLTERTLDMDPGEAAAVNRERLKKLDTPEDTIKKLLLNDKLTPTEKTQAVGYLSNLSGTPGLGALASFIAASDTRHGAVAVLHLLSYLAAGVDRISNVEIMERIPVLTVGDGKRVAIFTSDELAWTHQNADQLSRLGNALKGNSEGSRQKEIRISGNASPLATRELRRRGWIVEANAFNTSR